MKQAQPKASPTVAKSNSGGTPRIERSAGVVLFRETPAGRLFLLLDYGRHWEYPKGHLEHGEDDLTAARRELHEETGICNAQFLPDFSHEITYLLRHPKRGKIRKTVHFFLASTNCDTVMLSHEHVGCAWLSGEAALSRVTYPTAREVLLAALDHLAKPSKAVPAVDRPA